MLGIELKDGGETLAKDCPWHIRMIFDNAENYYRSFVFFDSFSEGGLACVEK